MVNNFDITPAGNETRTRAKPFFIRKLLGMIVLAIIVMNSVINANQNFTNLFK